MEDKKKGFSFQKGNYKILLIGLAINIIGFIFMIGGAAEDLNDFDFDKTALFSPMRINVAPMLIILGYIVIIYSIMKKPKAK